MSEIVLALVTLNLVQFLFWSYQVHKLVNKLMSRNYSEYNLAHTPPMTAPPKLIDEHLGEQDALSELNALLPS